MSPAAYFAFKGLVLGFALASSVGPIWLLCLKRSLEEGPLVGLAGGLGTAAADAAYAAVAAFGLSALSAWLVSATPYLAPAGALVLLWLGIKGLRQSSSKPGVEVDGPKGAGLVATAAVTFFLTIANPMTILSFLAFFAGLGLADAGGDGIAAAMLVGGVFIGSLAWWIVLSVGAGLLRRRIDAIVLLWVNRLSALTLVGFGAAILVGRAFG